METNYFEDQLAEKLRNQEITPPANLWGRIESSLDIAPILSTEVLPKKRRYLGAVISSATVAAMVLLSLLLIRTGEDENRPIKAEITPPTTISTPKADTTEETTEILTVTALKKEPVKTIKQSVANMIAAASVEETIASPEVEEKQESEAEEDQKSDVLPRKTKSTPNGTLSQHRTFSEVTGKIAKTRKTPKGVIVGISGSGNIGASSASTTNRVMFANKITQMNGASALYASTEKVVDWKHSIPLSVSATVQKMLTRRIGIETGLTYTYLSSHSDIGVNPKVEIKQRLHYLGIPVSVVCNIAEGKNFNFYAKGGFLVDKAISTEYKTYLEKKSISEKVESEGVQWTGSVQLGASYKVNKLISLYLEPTVNYYFKSNQPDSYRTENDFGFSAALGIRFKL